METGMLLAVPNDNPAGEEVEEAIREALDEADDEEIMGRDVTPYVLRKVNEKTGGESLNSNISLVLNNAKVGAEVAVAIADKEQYFRRGKMYASAPLSVSTLGSASKFTEYSNTVPIDPKSVPTSRVVVMGGAAVDIIARPLPRTDLLPETSNPGSRSESDGGVGRNIAEVLGRMGETPLLYSAVGDDPIGRGLVSRLRDEYGVVGVESTVHTILDARTAAYIAVLDGTGDLSVAVADMEVLSKIPVPDHRVLEAAEVLIMDANAPMETLTKAALSAVDCNVSVFFEPTSIPKAVLAGRRKDFLSCLTYASPNVAELLAMADGWTDSLEDLGEATKEDDYRTVKVAAAELLGQMRPGGPAHVVVTLGADGVLLASRDRSVSELDGDPQFTHFPATDGIEVENCTGAGDALCGAFVRAILKNQSVSDAVREGMEAAERCLLRSDGAISPDV